jgi:hypothetical protein
VSCRDWAAHGLQQRLHGAHAWASRRWRSLPGGAGAVNPFAQDSGDNGWSGEARGLQ